MKRYDWMKLLQKIEQNMLIPNLQFFSFALEPRSRYEQNSIEDGANFGLILLIS
jgi:hypothetical protein